MLLLNARTYALKFFHTAKTAPPYAILSHTWEDDEVLFKDMDDLESAKTKSGWQKIEYICRQALEDGLEWAWVDTCCIDKSSSAELSEAINSMFNWYKCSTVCYVYLCDLTMTVILRDDYPMVSTWLERANRMATGGPDNSTRDFLIFDNPWESHVEFFQSVTSDIISAVENDDEVYSRPRHELDMSLLDTLGALSTAKWWSRGWTLQELLAPTNLVFMDRHWQQIARLPDFVVTVSVISSVDVEVLAKTASLQSRCIAERLSWASKRSTTRTEDTAYALLGIFDAAMPLLYGEGNRAFKRLQEVISLRSNDLSIYAWPRMNSDDDDLMFSSSPSNFVNCAAVRKRNPRPITDASASDLQIMLIAASHAGLFDKLYSWLRLKAPIVYPTYLRAAQMSVASARKARSQNLTIIPHQTNHVSFDIEHFVAARLTVHFPKEKCLPVENAYPKEFWNLYTNQFNCTQRDLTFPLTAGLKFKAPDGQSICLTLRLYRKDLEDLPLIGKNGVPSDYVYDWQGNYYRCYALLVPEVALDQACTQFSPLCTPISSLTDVATCWHSGHSQNVSRLSLGGKHLTVEVVAGKDHTIENGMIAFDIFIRATTPTTEKDHNTGRFPWLKRRKDQSRSDNK
ncbi:hypothetical protein D0866_01311 [Hortaea werneckii]|uniref:Heterokaryon incompatibility domain-containing protein n=1 Tax=Hortaea werneckii TaxID=91943 RepID=A0A3M7BL81_HORWE|nr:hypothetical protein D0866_01311 [Hortaea werneckii]